MENENLKPVQELTPFTKMIMTIGALPTSFYSSMSYYESMVWLYEYLKNEVIPTVNNNAEAVEELQQKFIEFTGDINEEVSDFKEYINDKVEELETYMNNYFENLDVQDEINNKLDEMATDGTLQTLIENYVNPILNNYVDDIKLLDPNDSYIHISFDDVFHSFNDLKINANSYDSIFDNAFFNYLKTMHENYNAKFSLYIFTDYFANFPNKFANDFTNNYEWLKIGYHALNGSDNLELPKYKTAQTRYNDFTSTIINMCGTPNIIDKVPRLANFAGNIGACCALRDADCGCLGFLSADDNRTSYYLDTIKNNYLNKFYNLKDEETGLHFIKSITRLESIVGNIKNYLANYLTTSLKVNACRHFEIFTHEDVIYTSTQGIKNNYIEQVCQFASEHNIKFDYAQNHIFNNTNVANIKDETKYYDKKLTTANITNPDFKVGGVTDAQIDTTLTNTGRAVSNNIIAIPVNSTIEFTNPLNYDLSFTLFEFGSNPANEYQNSGQFFDSWIETSSYNLNTNTKYLIIVIKKRDNSTIDFTNEELLLLNSAFSLN